MTRGAPKVSAITQAVLDSRRMYPELLADVVSRLNNPAPYMQEKLDPRTVDKRLLKMSVDDMINLARTDPAAAEQAAQRISELEAKAPPLPPGQGEFEE